MLTSFKLLNYDYSYSTLFHWIILKQITGIMSFTCISVHTLKDNNFKKNPKNHNTIIKLKELHNNSLILMESYTGEQRRLLHVHFFYLSSLAGLVLNAKEQKRQKIKARQDCVHTRIVTDVLATRVGLKHFLK